ncbi:hypothetical protein [Aquimarina pacifica]|uniref:hypothetical protein n=1 Tax=Aquimarina pacifica TaxID=1296415 RepID=UPI00046FB8B7|nr:hypothetical protein [Aquimarina pacifica]
MESDLNMAEVRLIIRNLITFIVIEGKEYVNDDKKKAYVAGYVNLLVKTIHLIDEEEKKSIIQDISNDITTYLG